MAFWWMIQGGSEINEYDVSQCIYGLKNPCDAFRNVLSTDMYVCAILYAISSVCRWCQVIGWQLAWYASSAYVYI